MLASTRSSAETLRMSDSDFSIAAVTPDRPLLGPVLATLGWLRQARRELEMLDTSGIRIAPAIRGLRNIEQRITRPVKIAILGEFNSGKSTLANMMLGVDGLPTAVVSNTCIPTSLSYADVPAIVGRYEDGRSAQLDLDAPTDIDQNGLAWLDVRLPLERLRDYQIIDLPGVGDPSRAMPTLERARLQPDAVIWCTVATQAWRESERIAWMQLPPRLHRNTLLVATFADLLIDVADHQRVRERLIENAAPHFGDVVMLATVDAALADREPDPMARATAQVESGAAEFKAALERLATQVMQHRIRGAQALAGRVASRMLQRLES
jgi:GTPase SAR1 family protein